MPAYYCIGDCKKSQRGEVMSYKPYKTVNKSSEEEIIINKSRFIGRAFHVESEEEALSILAAIRKQHYDARVERHVFPMTVSLRVLRVCPWWWC